MKALALGAALAAGCLAAVPAQAQDADRGTVYDGDWLSVGIGAIYGPSYDGSDDGVVTPLPILQGSFGGIGFNPRPGGLALDFIDDADDASVKFNAGVAARISRNRASQIKDEIVEQYGKLDTAIEVGPSLGVSFPGLLNPYDSLSFNVDALWDVAGAHDGMTVSPSMTYFTPVSRGAALSLSLSARHVDDDYAAYYYSVPLVTTIPVADRLPTYAGKGGFDKMGVTALVGIDLDGDLTNGGLSAVVLGGYSRMMGDGKDTPFTSVRGSADQWMIGAGLGYTF